MEEANRLLPVVRRADAIVNTRSGSVVEIEEFPEDFVTYLHTDINWSRLEGDSGESHVSGWVFWSRQDDRPNPLPVSDLENVDVNPNSIPKLKDNIRLALGKIILHPRYGQSLVQFWAATKIDGRTLLTTKNQPFALCKTGRSAWGLCNYRMKSMKYKFYGDIGVSGEEELGLPGRVFLYKLSESVPDVRCYSFEEYPQHHDASLCRVRASWALPVFEHSSQVCAGVLELVSAVDAISDWHDKSFLCNLYNVFQEVGLQLSDVYKHYEMKNGQKCQYVQTIQASHELLKNGGITSQHGPLDQPSFDALNDGMDVYNEGQDDNFGIIAEGNTTKTQEREHKKTGVRFDISLEDVLCFAALSHRDAARGLRVSESTLKRVCRKYGIHRWPPLDLNKEEVFPGALPNVDATVNGPHDASIDHSWPSNSHLENESILETNDLQQHLGRRREDVSVSSMKRICRQHGITWWPYQQNGAAMTRLDSSDQPSLDAVNNGRSFISAECSNMDITCSEEGSVIAQERKKRKTGVRIEIPLEDVLKYSKMTLGNAARKLKVGSSTLRRVCRQYGIHRWPPRNTDNTDVPLLENPRPSPDVPLRNIDKVAQPSCVELQDGIPQSTSNMPSNQVSDSRDYRIHLGPPPNINKVGGPWSSHVEYQEGISLLTCDMPSNGDWPPHNINKVGSTKSSLVQHEEGISQLVSDAPSNQVLDSVAHVKSCDTTFQEAEMVTIRAKYVIGHTIKFKLSMWPKLEELWQQVAKRLNLRAETYDIMYDEDGERIQIACDEALHLCIRSSRALGKNSIVVLLLPKKLTPLV